MDIYTEQEQTAAEETVKTEPTFEEYVKMSIDSGVPPLELFFSPIVKCDSGFPIAYRTETTINSILLGTLPEEEYTYVSDKRCAAELLRHNVQHMITAWKEFAKAGRTIEFLSIRCPSELIEHPEVSLYDVMTEIIKTNPSLDPQTLCLEFPASLFEKDTEKARTAILDMQVLHLRTALSGVGKEDFPVSKLVTVTPDLVILDPSATAWAGSRDKPQLLAALVSYIKSMGCDAIAEGTEEQRKAMRNSECVGFITTGTKPLPLNEALAQKEEGDGK